MCINRADLIPKPKPSETIDPKIMLNYNTSNKEKISTRKKDGKLIEINLI